MGQQIIKQPNGKFCIFSSNCDNVTHYDCTVDEIIDTFVEEYKERITIKVKDIVSKLEKKQPSYHQFTMSYEEMLEQVKSIYGENEVKEIRNLIEK